MRRPDCIPEISRVGDVVVYAVKAEAVEILHIYHSAQDWR